MRISGFILLGMLLGLVPWMEMAAGVGEGPRPGVAEVEVIVHLPEGRNGPYPAKLWLTDDEIGERQGTEVGLPLRMTLKTAEGRGGVVEVTAPGLWAPPRRFVAGATEGSLELFTRPAGSLEGRLVATGEKMPEVVLVILEPAAGAPASEPPLPRVTVECPVLDEADGTFRCQLPAGFLDLRFAAEGLAPVERAGVEVPREGTISLGILQPE